MPSGKFTTNAAILAGAQLAYNILRWIGQNGLLGPDAPPRHRAKRRRIRTVMQELIYLAARLIHTDYPLNTRIYASKPESRSRLVYLLSQHASPKLCTLVQGFSCYTGILSSNS